QDRPVGQRVEELVRVPARRERARLRLAVADDAGDGQGRVVEGRAVGVRERVAELSTLVDRAGRLRCGVARDPARERELPEQRAQPRLVAADVRIQLAVRALEIALCDDGRAAVAGAADEDRVEVALPDRAVEMRVEEVEAGRRPPVAEQARLDVLRRERLAQEGVVEQVDLPDGEVVRGAPVRVERAQLLVSHDNPLPWTCSWSTPAPPASSCISSAATSPGRWTTSSRPTPSATGSCTAALASPSRASW